MAHQPPEMTTPRRRFLAKLACPGCGSAGLLDQAEGLGCTACGVTVPTLHGLPVFVPEAATAIEAASVEQELARSAGRFQGARRYSLEKAVMELLNPKEDLPITPYLIGREVLDVACGPDVYHYDARVAALHAGIDVSVPFLLQAAAIRSASFFACAYAHRLPFVDGAFDVVLLLQAMHHLPQSHRQILTEACRVARERVIVYDHLQSAAGPKRWLKTVWWRLADRGVRYNTEAEWRAVLEGLEIEAWRVTGRYLDNILEFVVAGPGARGDQASDEP